MFYALCKIVMSKIIVLNYILQGLSYDQTLNIRRKNFANCINLLYSEPVMITQGYMQYVWDQTGKRYLDVFGGIVTVSVGHCHP